MADENPPLPATLVAIVREAVKEDIEQIKADEKRDEQELAKLLTRLDLALIPLTIFVIVILTVLVNLGEVGVLTQPCGMAVARVATRRAL